MKHALSAPFHFNRKLTALTLQRLSMLYLRKTTWKPPWSTRRFSCVDCLGQPRPDIPKGSALSYPGGSGQSDAQELPPVQREELRLVALTMTPSRWEEDRLSRMHQRIHHGQLSASFSPTGRLVTRSGRSSAGMTRPTTAGGWCRWGMPHRAFIGSRHSFQRLSPWWSGFLSFFRADTLTGDKDPARLHGWMT